MGKQNGWLGVLIGILIVVLGATATARAEPVPVPANENLRIIGPGAEAPGPAWREALFATVQAVFGPAMQVLLGLLLEHCGCGWPDGGVGQSG